MLDWTLRAALVRVGFAVGRARPVAKRLVLATSHADRLSGNLAAIDGGLRAAQPPVPVVRLASSIRPGLRGLAPMVAAHLRAGYHLATARLFVVDDYFFPMYAVRPRAGTRYVQVWHGCGALKKFGYSTVEKRWGRGARSIGEIRMHANYDVCLVSTMRVAPFYAEAFDQPLDRFTSSLGIPRTDVLVEPERHPATIAAIRARYRLEPGRRVVLYAPTFRGDSIRTARQPHDLDLGALRDVLGADHTILVRAHPFVREKLDLASVAPFAIDVSDYPEINELMLVSDVLVTDYSSALFEFALLGRPIVLFAPDHADYEANRGLYVDYETAMPGPIFERSDALAAYLRAGEFDLERVRRCAAETFDVADGHATERFVRDLVRPALA